MTTPNQGGPDGAFVIGGGDWGQSQEANLLAIIPPPPTPFEALDQFRQALERLPLDVLKTFAPFLETVDDAFDNVGNAVGAIMDALQDTPLWLSVEAFTAWLAEFFKPITEGFDSLLLLLSGNFVEPAGEAFGAVIAWLGDLLNIDKFAEAIGALVDWVLGIPGEVLDTLADLLGLDFSGLEAFFDSIFANIKQLTGLDLSTPTAFFNSIATLVNGAIDNIATTVAEVTKILAQAFGYANPPANLTVPQLVTWVAGNVLGKLANLTTAGLMSVAALVGIIPFTQVDGPGDFTNIGAAVDKSFADIKTNIDTWYSALTGAPVTAGATVGLTGDQIAELVATTTANATALAALQSATQGSLTNMVASGDDFERAELNPAGQPAFWQQYDTGTGGSYSLKNGQMVWTDGGNADHLVRYRRVAAADKNTFTPYQRITRVNGTVIAEGQLLLSGPGEDYIYSRVSDDFSKYIYAKIRGDGQIVLGYSLSGPAGETPLKTVTATAPTAGSTYAIEAGDFTGLRSFRVLRNNITVLSYPSGAEVVPTAVSQLDTFKGWGWGGKAVNRGLGQSSPGSIHSITATDIPPEPTLGSFLHVCRDTTDKVTKASGDQLLPLNTFTKTIRNSPDITMDMSSGIFILAKPGPYTVACRLDTGADINIGDEWEMLLYEYVGGKTPTLRQRVAQAGGAYALTNLNTNTIDGVFQFYASGVNSQWAVGFRSNTIESVAGNANGDTTYLTVTKGT